MKHPRLSQQIALYLSAFLFALAALYLTMSPSFGQIPTVPTDTVVLTGRVTSKEDGKAIADVAIVLASPYTWIDSFEVTRTDSSGRYTVTKEMIEIHVQPFTEVHYVRFEPRDGLHIGDYYTSPDEPNWRTEIALSPDNVTSGIDGSLILGGLIRGRVISHDTKQPIADAPVILRYADGGVSTAEARTDSTGAYTLTNLFPVTYTLYAQPPAGDLYHMASYYPDRRTFAEAEMIELAAGKTITVQDFSLVLGGRITGRITSDELDHPLLPEVEAYGADGQLLTEEEGYFVADWDLSGPPNYAISHMLPGSYRLRFQVPDHQDEYYDNQPILNAAKQVTVKAGQTIANIDAEMKLSRRVVSIATSPALPGAMALTLHHIPTPFVTWNGGQSWQRLPIDPWNGENQSQDFLVALAPRPEAGSRVRILVAATFYSPSNENGIYRTGDNGQSWSGKSFPALEILCNVGPNKIQQLIASSAEPTRIYNVHACDYRDLWGFSDTHTYQYISQNAGIDWQEFAMQGEFYLSAKKSCRLLSRPIDSMFTVGSATSTIRILDGCKVTMGDKHGQRLR